MVACLVFILRYKIIIRLIYFFKNNKISNSIYFPSFIRKQLKPCESVSKTEELPILIYFFYKHL